MLYQWWVTRELRPAAEERLGKDVTAWRAKPGTARVTRLDRHLRGKIDGIIFYCGRLCFLLNSIGRDRKTCRV